jgi:uncharacterized protein YukE
MAHFKTDQEQMAFTVTRVQGTVEQMQNQAKRLIGAVDAVTRWQGETANAFRSTMGINTTELGRLVEKLNLMHQGLNETLQGVVAQEARGKQQMTATVQPTTSLSGSPLNA